MLLSVGGAQPSLEKMDEMIRRHFMNNNSRQFRHQHGVFLIEGYNIKFERWYPGTGPGVGNQAFVRSGIILNDTTFHITKSFRSDGTQVRERNEVFHFREFSPKPDSTNIWWCCTKYALCYTYPKLM